MVKAKRTNLRTVWLTDLEIEIIKKIMEEKGISFSDVLRRGIYCESDISALEEKIREGKR